MKKSLISLAVAAAVAAPVAAFADSNVVVYGVANVSADSVNNGAVVNGVTKAKISSNTSRLGFKGNEDLGDGLSAIWQVESLISIDGNTSAGNVTSTFASRNTFAGLSSTSLGTVIMGKHDTPYKIATRAYDVFGDGIADNRALMGTAGGASFDGRQANVIAYISPVMAGFTGIAGFVQLSESPAVAKGNAFSLAGMYKGTDLPLTASLSYEEHILDFALGAGAKETAIKAGASYAIDALTVAAVYEQTQDNFLAGADQFGHKSVYASAKYAIGAGAIKAAYTQVGAQKTVANSGAKQWTLGYDHGLSKRTTVYGLYTKLNNNAGAVYGLFAGETGGVASSGGANSAPSAFSLGVKHSF
ncbi:Outer membrane porin protein 32 [Ferriphaselus amnicola]|uniref:Outer membrane porin protein 32 n=1 Tax=Ferriphaselus amnicola TaxID=1188319 RepID=A0A2Z6GF02_9PROT|nr:porin [Ferriphaselus amnicola]BBE51942.1 Outer membrane porin protein 32 [Ferriphaselus amnicola]